MDLSDFEKYAQKMLEERARREEADEDSEFARQKVQKYLLAGLSGTERFGPFELHEHLGLGAFGVVFLARDTRRNQRVALKLPLPQVILDPKVKKSFVRDAKAGLLLDHPGIVKVYEFDEIDGIPYIASQYVEGPTLERWLKKQNGGISADTAVDLMIRIADAVEHAHSRGVVHRDLKPANILLKTVAAEPASFIQPMITDFGLARVRDVLGLSATATRAIVGSIPYMAPEQITGPKDEVGPRSDIYALGVILYRMLTGKMPFSDISGVHLMNKIVRDPFQPVRSRQASVPADLATVCERCLRKKPHRRFASGAELREELERFRSGARVMSRPLPLWEKACDWCRRYPAVTVAMLAGISTIGLQTYQVIELRRVNADLIEARNLAERNEKQAEENLRLANDRNRLARRYLYDRRLIDAQAAMADHNAPLTQQILTEIDPGEADREFVWKYLWRKSREKMEFIPRKDGMTNLLKIFNPGNGRWLVVQNFLGKLQIYDTRDWSLAGEIDLSAYPGSGVYYATLSPDGRRIYATIDGRGPVPVTGVAVWDTLERKTLYVENVPPVAKMVGVKLIPDSDTLLVWGQHEPFGTIALREHDLAKRTSKDRALGGDYGVIAFSQDGNKFVGAQRDGKVYLVDFHDTRIRKELKYTGEPDWTTLRIHDEGGLVFMKSDECVKGQDVPRILVWKSSFEGSGEPFLAHTVPYDRAVGFWPLRAKNMVLVARADVGAGLLDLESGITTSLDLDSADPGFGRNPGFDLRDQHILHDGTLLMHTNQEGIGARWLAWDLKTKKQLIDPSIRDSFRPFASASREFLFGIDDRKLLRWWPKRRFTQPEALTGHDDEVWCAAFTPDSTRIVTGSDDKDEAPTLKAWDRATGQMLWAVKAHASTVSAIAMDPGGKVVATGSLDKDSANVRLWDMGSGRMTADLKGIDQPVRALRFSPDGTRLAAGDKKGRCVVWDVATGKVVHDFPVGTDRVLCLAFSDDVRNLISSTEDGWIRAWNLADKKKLREFYTGSLTQGVTIDPDLKTAAGVGEDKRLFVVDFETGQNLRHFEMPGMNPWAVMLFPDGKTLAAGDKAGNLMMWDLETGTEKFRTKAHEAQINALTLSPDGKTLVSCAHDGTVKLWHAGPEF